MQDENLGADLQNRQPSRPGRKSPGHAVPAVQAAMARFLACRAEANALPTPEEMRAYLDTQVAERGRASAQVDFAFLQIGAAERWGAAETAFFAHVLREHRVTAKPKSQSRWQRAEAAIGRLPQAWQGSFRDLVARARSARPGTKGLVWSESRLQAVAEALARWHGFCDAHGLPPAPTGASLTAYAEILMASGRAGANSVGDYLERILAGYHDVVTGTAPSQGALFVCRLYQQRRMAPTTKKANQIVGASAIYDLGLDLIDQARRRPVCGTETATLARNAILLLLAVALGERSRALSALVFDKTLHLGPRPEVRVDLPGEALKGPQVRKAVTRRREIFQNPDLWDALDEYRRVFRPVFDGGDALFPSKLALGHAVNERTLSKIVGRLTDEHLGARITLHRIRDNLATEAVEDMTNGLSIAASVLGHRDARITAKHYDRAQGRAAMALVASLTGRKRGPRTRLRA